MVIETPVAEAQQIISDPTFNAEKFVKTITMFFQNREIIKSLGSDVHIFLGLLENDNGKIFEFLPQYVNTKIFDQLHEMGYEVWFKEKQYDVYRQGKWYGAVINDNLGINFKSIGSTYNLKSKFKIYKDIKALKAKFRINKMTQIGAPAPVKLDIESFRDEFIKNVEKHLNIKYHKRWTKNSPNIVFKLDLYNRLRFKIHHSKKNFVKVSLSEHKLGLLITDNLKQGIDFNEVSRFFAINEPHVWFKIMEWVSTATKQNLSYFNFGNLHHRMTIYKTQNNL